MSINWISLAQFILLILLGAFFGNLLSILVDKKNVDEENRTQDKPKVSEAILSSLRITLLGVPWLLLWLSLFSVIPLYWHSIYQH